MIRVLFCVLALLLSLASVGDARAEMITVLGHPGDGTIDVNGLPQDFPLPELRAGVGGNNLRGLAPIFFFALPAVPSPDSISGAELQVQFLGLTRATLFTPPEFNADLFGLGVRPAPVILSTDYHDGDASLSSDVLLAEGFITPTTAPGLLSVTGLDLLTFIRSLYLPDGSPTAAYAVFRINPDVHLPPFSGQYRGYELASSDNPVNGGALVPQLQLTVVSEPSTLFVSVWGMLLLVGARSRFCRGARNG